VSLALALAACLGGHGSGAAQERRWPAAGPPRPLAAREAKFPPIAVRTLANGLPVAVVVHDEQPAVSLRLIVRAGSAQDPPSKPGVAALAMSLLDQGTATRSAQQIADAIDTIGGRLETGPGRDLSFVNVVVMKDSFDLAIGLLADLVRNPAFAPEEIERQRQQTLSALQVSADDPDYLASVVFDRLVYGFHPYGYPGHGTRESMPLITRDDLRAFHSRYVAPNNCILAIVGDVAPGEAAAAVEKALADWPRREIPAVDETDAPPPARRVIVLDKPGAAQTEVRVGHLAIPRSHPDYLALDLAVRILGGEGANRLHQVLRTERGLTYGAAASLESLKRGGQCVAETSTRAETTAEVLRLIVDEFFRLRRERVSEHELADAKTYLTGSLPASLETPEQIATHILNVLFYELPLDELQTYRQRVNAITVDDVERVARWYLKPDQLSVVLVGDAQRFVDDLRGVGFGKYERVSLAELDLASADFRRHVASDGQRGLPLLVRPR
jgi:zinc protease